MFVAVTVEVFKRVHARRIKRRHAAHADDQVFRELLDRDIGNLVGHAKEHRTVDFVYAYALGKLAQVRDLRVFIAVILPAFDFGFFAYHLHEQHHGDQHAHGNGGHQVNDYG